MPFPTIQAAMRSGETLIFGHRGAMAKAPMNTLAAFDLAYKKGADGIELDVQLCKDGSAVVIHDHSVDATSNSAGNVADFTLAELKALDAGAWFAPDFAGERIPTLDEVCRQFGRKLLLNIEIKSSGASAGALEAAVAASITRHRLENRVIVSSFNPLALRQFKALRAEVMLGFLYSPTKSPETEALMRHIRHEARHPWQDSIDAAYMSWARANTFYVNAWTVNEPERARQLRRLGVNAIITDDPAAMRGALRAC